MVIEQEESVKLNVVQFVQTILSYHLMRNSVVNDHAFQMSHSISYKMVHVLTAHLAKQFHLIKDHVKSDHACKVKCALTMVHVDTVHLTRNTKVIAHAEQITVTSDQHSRKMEHVSFAHCTLNQMETKEEPVSVTVAGPMLF